MSDGITDSSKGNPAFTVKRLFFPKNEESNMRNLLGDLCTDADKIDYEALFKTDYGKRVYDKFEDHVLETFAFVDRLNKIAEKNKQKSA